MRGKANSRSLIFCALGITPAYAGKSSAAVFRGFLYGDHPRLCGEKFRVLPFRVPRRQDHPRLCGEKLLVYTPKTPYVGSPPPMRGKVAPSTPKRKTMRITPAYAGKS